MISWFWLQAREKAQKEAEAAAKQQAADAAKQEQQAAASAAAAKPKPAAPKAAAPKAAPAQKPAPKATPPVPQVDAAEAAKRREAGQFSGENLLLPENVCIDKCGYISE